MTSCATRAFLTASSIKLGLELKKHAMLVLEQKKFVAFQLKLTFWCAVTFTCRWSGSPALAVRRHFCSVKKATLKSGSGSTFHKTCRAACSHYFCASSLQSSSGTSTPRASPLNYPSGVGETFCRYNSVGSGPHHYKVQFWPKTTTKWRWMTTTINLSRHINHNETHHLTPTISPWKGLNITTKWTVQE